MEAIAAISRIVVDVAIRQYLVAADRVREVTGRPQN